MSVEIKYTLKGRITGMNKTIDIDLAPGKRAAITLDARQINCYNEFFGCEASAADRAAAGIREGRRAAKIGAIGALIGIVGFLMITAAFLIHLL